MRLASYARTAASTQRYVVKSYKKDGKRLAHLAEDMRIQALCKAFALEFNALSGESQPIDFVVTTCFRDKRGGSTSKECMSLDPFLDGTYVKYNSNNGWVNERISGDRFNQAAQAFSHFTFERSRGRLLVSDLQGVGGVLTDPAVHALDRKRFRLADTNLGAEGFKFFFATHRCNALCEKLELKSRASMIKTGRYEFRKNWPVQLSTKICSNMLCGKIIHSSTAKQLALYPGYWCDACWPQLTLTTASLICVAPGSFHEFEESRFFNESQGQSTPRRCPAHRGSGESMLQKTSKISQTDLSKLFKSEQPRQNPETIEEAGEDEEATAIKPRVATTLPSTKAEERPGMKEVVSAKKSSRTEGGTEECRDEDGKMPASEITIPAPVERQSFAVSFKTALRSLACFH